MTITEAYDMIRDRLSAAGIEEAESESGIILKEAALADRTALLTRGAESLAESVTARLERIVERRVKREPLQYILGSWDFMGLEFKVSPHTLIPRQDTEVLVECVMKELHDGMRILDLCTGTGCILISLLKYSNDCAGTGIDISEDAVKLARENADRLLGDAVDVTFLAGDLYTPLSRESEGFDIIVSNPPYIPSGVIDTLAPEVRDYEPQLALDGGNDGLDIIRRILDEAFAYLIPGGALFMEIGFDQGETVKKIFEESGLTDVRIIRDYAQLDRIVTGRRPVL